MNDLYGFGIISLPAQSSGRAVAVLLVLALAKCLSFYAQVLYVMGKAHTGELSCPVTGLVFTEQ